MVMGSQLTGITRDPRDPAEVGDPLSVMPRLSYQPTSYTATSLPG